MIRLMWSGEACLPSLPSPAMAEEEALGGDSHPWVSSKGPGVVPEACTERECREASGEVPVLTPGSGARKPSAETKPVPILFSFCLKALLCLRSVQDSCSPGPFLTHR